MIINWALKLRHICINVTILLCFSQLGQRFFNAPPFQGGVRGGFESHKARVRFITPPNLPLERGGISFLISIFHFSPFYVIINLTRFCG